MIKANTRSSAQRIASASRLLVEGGMADAAAGRFSRTLFAAERGNDDALERITFEAAGKSGLGVVFLRLARDGTAMPRRVHLTFAKDGARIEVRGCVLWAEDTGPLLIVPFDAREDRHYAVGLDGLEERPGRPAVMLGRGMARAKARLEHALRGMRHAGDGDRAPRPRQVAQA